MRRLVPILTLALSLATTPAYAAGPASVELEDFTWTELRDAIAGGKTTAIVPIGGTEQNGPLMALGKHNARAKALAEQIAGKLGDAIVAPVMAYVPEGSIEPPQAHVKFPGTLTIPDATFESLLDWTAQSLRHAGFKTIVFLGDHGGYQKSMASVADRLTAKWLKSDVRVYSISEYYRVTQGDYVQALKDHGAALGEIGTHAGLADTSLMLAIDPALVRQDRLATDGGLTGSNGVYGGSPRHATAALGQLGVDLIVEQTVAAIHKAAARK
jgi:creatinine amidohydrolase